MLSPWWALSGWKLGFWILRSYTRLRNPFSIPFWDSLLPESPSGRTSALSLSIPPIFSSLRHPCVMWETCRSLSSNFYIDPFLFSLSQFKFPRGVSHVLIFPVFYSTCLSPSSKHKSQGSLPPRLSLFPAAFLSWFHFVSVFRGCKLSLHGWLSAPHWGFNPKRWLGVLSMWKPLCNFGSFMGREEQTRVDLKKSSWSSPWHPSFSRLQARGESLRFPAGGTFAWVLSLQGEGTFNSHLSHSVRWP